MRFSVNGVAAVSFLFVVGALGRQRDELGSAVRRHWIPDEHPFIVLIETISSNPNEKVHVERCMGTVVDGRHIVTTASCLEPCYLAQRRAVRIKVRASELGRRAKMELISNGQQRDFTYKTHRNYKTCHPNFDLAVIRTKAKFGLAKFALSQLHSQPLTNRVEGSLLVVRGKSDAIDSRRVRIQEARKCRQLSFLWLGAWEAPVCAVLADPPRSICPADNGAPLLRYNRNKRVYDLKGVLTLAPFVAGATATSCPLKSNTKYLFFSTPRAPSERNVWSRDKSVAGNWPGHGPYIPLSGRKRHPAGELFADPSVELPGRAPEDPDYLGELEELLAGGRKRPHPRDLGPPFNPGGDYQESDYEDLIDSTGLGQLGELLAELDWSLDYPD